MGSPGEAYCLRGDSRPILVGILARYQKAAIVHQSKVLGKNTAADDWIGQERRCRSHQESSKRHFRTTVSSGERAAVNT